VETFFPGILIPNHQSNTKTATTAMVIRTMPKKIFERGTEDTGDIRKWWDPAPAGSRPSACPAVAPTKIIPTLRELFPEPQSAQTKKQIRHHDKH
jgi:hypothetical protein